MVRLVLFLRFVCKVETTKGKSFGKLIESAGNSMSFVVFVITDFQVRRALNCPQRENIFSFWHWKGAKRDYFFFTRERASCENDDSVWSNLGEIGRSVGMMERRRIVRFWQKGGATVLATLVRAEGSSYRQPGARLLMGANGEYAGAISGGCLETEVLRKANWLVRDGAMLERYSTMFDDTADMPFGLGCGGVVDLLLEPAETPEFVALMTALEGAMGGKQATVLTWLPGHGWEFARAVLTPGGDFSFASERLSEPELVDARAGVLRGGWLDKSPDGLFVEEIRRPQRLFVLGAGDDAKPLVNMAALLGWSVIVMDGRANLARAERFPEAERVEVVSADLAGGLGIRREDAVVLMTHSYEQDRELLEASLTMRPRYLGLLGARHRSSLLVSEVAGKLGLSVEACCERIYAPVGLDLGGDGAEAIALAVIAEAQACCMGKLGTSRRLSAEDVERNMREGGASQYLQAQCAL
jgi:xanthine dehydrogenase accessory factor